MKCTKRYLKSLSKDEQRGFFLKFNTEKAGVYCHALATELFPICRSITGPGVRQTLERLRQELPSLTVKEVLSGTQVFDWTVPDEWVIRDAYIENEKGDRVVDFRKTICMFWGIRSR